MQWEVPVALEQHERVRDPKLMGVVLKGAKTEEILSVPKALHPDEQHAATEGPAGENV